MRMGGQLRVSSGTVIGFDMTAGLAMARALGCCEIAAAELLPEIEAAAVAAMNKQEGDGVDG